MIPSRAFVAGFISKFPTWWHYTLRPGPGGKARAGTDSARNEMEAGMSNLPTPRGWDYVSHILGQCLLEKESPFAIAEMVTGEVGPAATTDFMTYLHETDIPDPEEVLKNPDAYRPSGRVDVDFIVMTSVVAAVEGNVTPNRLVSAMKVCNAVVAHRGAYEAGSVAVHRLGPLVEGKYLKKLGETHKMSPKTITDLTRDLYKLYKPYVTGDKNMMAPIE